jgi:hypothetical protein
MSLVEEAVFKKSKRELKDLVRLSLASAIEFDRYRTGEKDFSNTYILIERLNLYSSTNSRVSFALWNSLRENLRLELRDSEEYKSTYYNFIDCLKYPPQNDFYLKKISSILDSFSTNLLYVGI